jgi:hypothetical protein
MYLSASVYWAGGAAAMQREAAMMNVAARVIAHVHITLSLLCGEQNRQKRLDSKANWERLSFRNCLQGACNFGTLVKSTKERRLSTLWRRRDPPRRAGVKASGAREKSLDQNQKRKAGYRSWNSNTIN